MSDTNPNPPSVEELTTSVEKLTRALEAERTAHKATKDSAKESASKFRARVASGFGLGEDADDETLFARLGDTEKTVAQRTEALTKERDEALARAADVESRWASEKVDGALRAAFEKSGAKPEHLEDYLTLARPLFGVDEKGNIATKPDAPNTIPGIDPAAWIHSELKAKRSHYFPLSTSGGAKGFSGIGNVGPNVDCFRQGTSNLTQQMAMVGRLGENTVRVALQRAGIEVPGWLR